MPAARDGGMRALTLPLLRAVQVPRTIKPSKARPGRNEPALLPHVLQVRFCFCRACLSALLLSPWEGVALPLPWAPQRGARGSLAGSLCGVDPLPRSMRGGGHIMCRCCAARVQTVAGALGEDWGDVALRTTHTAKEVFSLPL